MAVAITYIYDFHFFRIVAITCYHHGYQQIIILKLNTVLRISASYHQYPMSQEGPVVAVVMCTVHAVMTSITGKTDITSIQIMLHS